MQNMANYQRYPEFQNKNQLKSSIKDILFSWFSLSKHTFVDIHEGNSRMCVQSVSGWRIRKASYHMTSLLSSTNMSCDKSRIITQYIDIRLLVRNTVVSCLTKLWKLLISCVTTYIAETEPIFQVDKPREWS